MYIKRKLSISGYQLWQTLLFWIIWPIMTLTFPLMTIIDLQPSIIVNITITKKIGMLHIKRKPKTAVLQRKHVQASLRWNDWPQGDLHWPLMTSKLCNLEHLHDAYQKEVQHLRISFVTNILLIWIIWPSWPWFASKDLNWPPNLNNTEHYNY